MLFIAAMLVAIATPDGDLAAALADRRSLPAEDRPHTYYLSYAAADPEVRDELVTATRLMVASTSRQVVLERCTPQRVTDSLARIDLRSLKWDAHAWGRLLANYPYRLEDDGFLPLVVRADWLLVQLADANESPAYYELLFGEVPDKRDRWLELLGVDKNADPLLRFGMIEGESGVAVNKVRWLESFPVGRGYAWGTRDSLKVTPSNDPLEHPDGSFDHDGEEWIVGIPKLSLATGERGVLQVYLLSDGKGNRVDKAPIDLVEDSSRFRDRAEIVNPGSCVQCHDGGLNEPTRNELRDYLLSGAAAFTRDTEARDQLEAFHLGTLDRVLEESSSAHQRMVQTLTGKKPGDAAGCFTRAVRRHDAPLTLADVARELGVSEATARGAISAQTGYGQPLGARTAHLVHGGTIPRESFEERYREFGRYAHEWAAN